MIQIGELIKVDFEKQTISARELHESLKIGTRFNDWFPRMVEYGFIEGSDFYSKMSKTSSGGRPSKDYEISVDMAKQICMIQRTPEGKAVRQYLIELEKAWNTPELVMARALKLADKKIDGLEKKVLEMKPKAEFYDQVTDSKDAIDMKDCANVLHMGIGRNKLFKFLRDQKILTENNRPYQEFVDMGYFRTVEQKYDRGYGEVGINVKTLVFQKGVDYIRRRLIEKGYK